MTDTILRGGQVGGNHYQGGMQPFELSYRNRHDACIHAIQKYLTRHAQVNPEKGYESLRKAHHICAIRLELGLSQGFLYGANVVEAYTYCESNGIDGIDRTAICAVEMWSQTPSPSHSIHRNQCETAQGLIRQVARAHYPEKFKIKDFEL